ncbi:transposase [Variovorax sp. dw_308]|uniref:IS66 family transposase n=1 Tax=Variovorax sp. dw_308 TaxID=2721546 RepID=UPI0035278739
MRCGLRRLDRCVGQLPLHALLLGEAFGYALSNWAALNTFIEHGILEADNNISERAMKPVALSRNNANCGLMRTRTEAERVFPRRKASTASLALRMITATSGTASVPLAADSEPT